MPEFNAQLAGGLPILLYSLEWNSGGAQETNWSSLVESSSRTFTVSSGLTTGTQYKFRYRVSNELD